MFATLVSVALFATAAIKGVAADFTVDTPQFTTCQPATFNWNGGQGPYNVIMVHPGECDAAVDLGDQQGTSATWTVNVTAGTQLEISVLDYSTNEEAWSGIISVAQGSDTSCIQSNTTSATPVVVGTTLKVDATPSSSSSSSASTSSAAGPLGAVGNNGPIKSDNGAMTQVAAPAMILSAVAGILAFSL